MGKTSKMMAGITSTALMIGLSGCGPDSESQDIPDPPEDSSCSDWEWDEDDGVWECDDSRSSYYGHYFFGGLYYANRASLFKSKDYIKYKNSSSFKGRSITSGGTKGTGKKSSGFGSGTKSYGG